MKKSVLYDKPGTCNLSRLFSAAVGIILVSFWSVGGTRAASTPTATAKQPVSEPKKSFAPLNRFPRMVQGYFVEEVHQIVKQAEAQRAGLQTKFQAQEYVRQVRSKIQQSFGPWPEKTDLNPRITGVLERDTYKIEKVIFESRPGFLVTANLYIPKNRKFPLPGVVGACGHMPNGKASEAYQSFAQGLVRMGYVVLIYDPIGQGERLQYPDENLKSRIGVGVGEHLYCGNQQFLVGEFFGSWRAWDGIRALDYLLSREEVDAGQVGVTGNSGGGTMTTWLCGVERRFAMGAPGCFVTSFRRNLENELPADTEQCPPRALALGLDHSDFLAALAPKPVIILAKEKDFFDVRGSEQAYERLKHLYRLLGREDNVNLFIGPGYHGYTQENREAMYRWFNRETGISDAQSEPELTIEKDEDLWCAPEGQVCRLDSRTVYSFTKEKSQQLAQARSKNMSRAQLKERIIKILKPGKGPHQRSDNCAPEYRILRGLSGRDYPQQYAGCYAVETEPSIYALVYRLSDERLYSRPPKGSKRAILYISHHSSDVELREEPLIKELVESEPNTPLFACDVRGIGESQPDTCGPDSFLKPYGSDFFYAIHAIMLDKPYLGQKTYDVLRVLYWLKSCGHDEIHLAGTGWGALAATFAAVLSDQVKQVTLKNALESYTDIAESVDYDWPLSTLLPDVLQEFDLPDCYRILQDKKLRLIEPWDACAKPASNNSGI